MHNALLQCHTQESAVLCVFGNPQQLDAWQAYTAVSEVVLRRNVLST